ncbi:antibiotic biosynthesis monooxygenase family protein [Cellvibrio sp. ARAG 10.3]|uniref:antibiotic biosynthesis monooxygenase family protein n=1 Tax=Cellvibrio sp. ARAG 10.3 TaxID=3451358 RepID=UPI003F47AD19
MAQLPAHKRLYRLDKFIVPVGALEEFLAKVKSTHQLLRNQAGFIQDFLLERPLSDEAIQIATLVEWQDQQSIDNARHAVMAAHKSSDFNAQAFTDRLGIKVEMGSYQPIAM